jgi:hypothetical protein
MPGMTRSAVGASVAAVAALLLFASSASAGTVDKLDAPSAQLDRAATNAVPGGGQIRHYQQKVGGLPVFGAEAVVVVPPGADTVVVSDTTAKGRSWSDASAKLSRSKAIAAARSATGARRLRAPGSAKLGYDKSSGKLAWEVAIDAISGEKLRAKDVLKHATGVGAIYNPNPVVQQGGYSGLKDKNDKDYALLTNLRLPVSLERIIDNSKGCLKGQYVEALIGDRGKKACAQGYDFSAVTRSDDTFEAEMAYFHIDRTRFYADGLGLSQPLRSKRQKVYVNAIPDDNSFYSSQTQQLVLGEGGVDDGEDADVIVHEYGHSLQDQASPHSLQSRQGGTIGEGFGDYMAAAMSDLTTGPSPFDTCIFDWDGISYSNTGCGRDAAVNENLKTAERKCQKEIHCVGQVVSSTLFSLRQTLGNDTNGQSIIDRVVLEANFMNSKGTTYKSFGKAIVSADQLLYAGAHIPTIEAELIDRKFCKSSGC